MEHGRNKNNRKLWSKTIDKFYVTFMLHITYTKFLIVLVNITNHKISR